METAQVKAQPIQPLKRRNAGGVGWIGLIGASARAWERTEADNLRRADSDLPPFVHVTSRTTVLSLAGARCIIPCLAQFQKDICEFL